MKNKMKSWMFVILGILLIVGGLIAVRFYSMVRVTWPYLCIGAGCGLLGHGAGELVTAWSEKGHPEAARQRIIEENDERNLLLHDRSQAKAYRIMIPVFGALFVAFGLMQVEIKVLLFLVAAYLYVCGCSIYYNVKYRKEM